MHRRALALAARLGDKRRHEALHEIRMPTLFRFLSICAVLTVSGFALVFSLAHFVRPNEREMTVRVSTERLLQAPTQE